MVSLTQGALVPHFEGLPLGCGETLMFYILHVISFILFTVNFLTVRLLAVLACRRTVLTSLHTLWSPPVSLLLCSAQRPRRSSPASALIQRWPLITLSWLVFTLWSPSKLLLWVRGLILSCKTLLTNVILAPPHLLLRLEPFLQLALKCVLGG